MTQSKKDYLNYAYNKNLTIQCEEFIHVCNISHDDGSLLYLTNCLVEDKEDYFVIFTEHLGYFVFDKEDVEIMLKLTKE